MAPHPGGGKNSLVPWLLRRGLPALLLFSGGSLSPAQTNAATPNHPSGTPSASAPAAFTNAPADAFSSSHPELNQPAPPEPSLTFRPSPAPEAPGMAPPAAASAQFVFSEGDPEDLPQHLLVVYNSSDPESKSLAQYYASRRDIPAERILGIACPLNEEITRAQYQATIREPIISYIYKRGWMTRRSLQIRVGDSNRELLVATRNDIWAIVLMRGVPLKIAEDPDDHGGLESEPRLQANAAAVDSELALLPIFGLPDGGFVPNPFYDGAGTGLLRAGPELATRLILVTRLDAPTPAEVRRMIDDTLYAEQNRLAGLAVIDTRGLEDVKNTYTLGDTWLREAGVMLAHDGWLVHLDTAPDVIPPSDPLNHVALYLGWYHDGAYGPWVTPPDRFERGAIAYHLHSFSATTLRSDTTGWAGPLLAHGAAATMGCVNEPYLDLTPHLQIFTRRLLDGDSFAEAAYASQKGLSWMITVIGDPLYRPFRQPLSTALAAAGPPTSDHYDWLLLQQVQHEIALGELPDISATLEKNLNVPGAVAQEGLGDLLEKIPHDPAALAGAVAAYQNAGSLATRPIDRIRIGLKLAQVYQNSGQSERAQAQLSLLRDLYPEDAARFGVASPLVPTGSGPPTPDARDLVTPALATPHSAHDSALLPRPPRPPRAQAQSGSP